MDHPSEMQECLTYNYYFDSYGPPSIRNLDYEDVLKVTYQGRLSVQLVSEDHVSTHRRAYF